MFLFVGLGNIGKQYATTRHNIGFMAVDILAQELFPDHAWERNARLHGEVLKSRLFDQPILLLKPHTLMNLSGRAAAAAMQYYRLQPKDVVVIQDDLDLPIAKLRLKFDGGSGGHNGIKSISSHIGSAFTRIKIGIKVEHPVQNTASFVLQPFAATERILIDQTLAHIPQIISLLVSRGLEETQNRYNNPSL